MAFFRLAAFATALTLAAFSAFPQAYPARPIALVVPFAAGGPTDTIARILGERMGRSLGQTVIVENVTGAGGSIGVNKVARSTPDGYMIGIGHIGTHVIVEAIQPVQFDVLKKRYRDASAPGVSLRNRQEEQRRHRSADRAPVPRSSPPVRSGPRIRLLNYA